MFIAFVSHCFSNKHALYSGFIDEANHSTGYSSGSNLRSVPLFTPTLEGKRAITVSWYLSFSILETDAAFSHYPAYEAVFFNDDMRHHGCWLQGNR